MVAATASHAAVMAEQIQIGSSLVADLPMTQRAGWRLESQGLLVTVSSKRAASRFGSFALYTKGLQECRIQLTVSMQLNKRLKGKKSTTLHMFKFTKRQAHEEASANLVLSRSRQVKHVSPTQSFAGVPCSKTEFITRLLSQCRKNTRSEQLWASMNEHQHT